MAHNVLFGQEALGDALYAVQHAQRLAQTGLLAVRQVDLVGTFLTDGLVLDPGCQQAGRRVAADGA